MALNVDPGFVKPHHFKSKDDKEFVECLICKTVKINLFYSSKPLKLRQMPLHVHHCSQCGKCVLGMDHHCGFTGSCIGVGNVKYFFLFLIYIFLQCASGAFLILRYSISHNLTDYIQISPIKSFFLLQTYVFRWTIVNEFVSQLDSEEAIDYYRELLGFYRLNHTSGEEMVPKDYDPN
jgi:hypothetical protein